MATNEFELMRFCREAKERYHMTKLEMDYADDFVHTADKKGGKDYGHNVSFIFQHEFSAFEYILDECINEAQRVFYGTVVGQNNAALRHHVYIAVVDKKTGMRVTYQRPQLKRVTTISLPTRPDQREGYVRALTESIKKRGFSIVLFL